MASVSGQGTMLGGVSGVRPSEVVILGAGTVGEYATRSALGLGASVKVFDNSVHRLIRLQNSVGQRLWTSTLQPSVLEEALQTADVAIGAVRGSGPRAPMLVSEPMVAGMRERSIIVDVSIDRGGVFETSRLTSHERPTFLECGVIHYCVPNIPSRVSRTASKALSNIFAPMLDFNGGVHVQRHTDPPRHCWRAGTSLEAVGPFVCCALSAGHSSRSAFGTRRFALMSMLLMVSWNLFAQHGMLMKARGNYKVEYMGETCRPGRAAVQFCFDCPDAREHFEKAKKLRIWNVVWSQVSVGEVALGTIQWDENAPSAALNSAFGGWLLSYVGRRERRIQAEIREGIDDFNRCQYLRY
jgi:hypothetical protein